MISKTKEQVYTMHYIIEQNNRPGYKMYMPTYISYFNTHPTCYKDIEYKDVDKRAHGWCDVIIQNKDGTTKYYKFIEIGTDKVYKGWLKKWSKIEENNHFVVLYTSNKTLQNNKYAIYSFQNFSEHYSKYTTKNLDSKEWAVLDQFYTKECISIQFSPITSTRHIQWLKQCFDNAIDNPWEYLTHKSSGFVYIYKNWTYYSLSDLYENTVYSCKYNKLDSFRKAFQRGTITDIQKIPACYVEKQTSVDGGRATPPYPLASKAAHNETNLANACSEVPKAKSSLAYSGIKQNKSVNNKSKEQETRLKKEPKSSSMWSNESVGTFDYLRQIIEEENKNKVITPIKVYKCKRA